MNFQQRDRLRVTAAIVLVCLTALSLLFRLRIGPITEKLVLTHVDNQASDTINLAIFQQIEAGEIDYDRIVDIQKNAQGQVTAVKTNMEEVNRLKTAILLRVDEKLEKMSLERLEIPAGSMLWPELFSGKGPNISVRVIAARTSDAEFHSSFSSAGINQTLHSITIDIHVVVTVLTWTGTMEMPVETSVLAAQTVIVGTVPNTYFGLEEQHGSETGD